MYNSIDICDELAQNFLDFSYEANSQRAFPDARDGLKPGQRACLWEMYHKGYTSNKAHVKSAKISGGVIASWWPHGDTAIYETFARMSQPWINNVPEVDWHGANGNQIMGSRPASSRYTEARLSKMVEKGMLKNINKNNVPMIPNFSEDEQWPEVLPALFPRLMVNGSQGIGSTIANTWLCHSFDEVAQLLINYLKTGELDYSNLYPSFPTGGIIINKDEVHQIYRTGKGKVVLRGKAEIKGNTIYITEMPYQVFVEPYIDQVKEKIVSDELTGVAEIYNKSDKKGILIEIVCDENPNVVLNRLYSKTDLQKSYNANQWALIKKTPKLLTLKDYCDIYVNHNLSCLVKEKEFDKNEASKRLHIVNGLLIALEDIDNIITLIKKSNNSSEAKETLKSKYNLSEEQAKAILAMRLSSLAKLEKIELEKEKNELENLLKEINNILSSVDKQKEIIMERLMDLSKNFSDKRKTEVIQIAAKTKEEKEIEFIEPEKCVVVMNGGGYIKRIPASSFKVQNKNGKGIKTNDDIITDVIRTNTIDNLMVFTNKGKMYKILVDDIPQGTNTTKGTNLKTLIPFEAGEEPTLIYSIYRDSNAKFILFVTKKGIVKKTSLDEYVKTKKKNGIAAISLREDDTLASVSLINDEELILITKNGMGIRFKSLDVGATGRTSVGVKGIIMDETDEIVSALAVRDSEDDIALFTDFGTGKRIKITDLNLQNRAGKGLIVYKKGKVNCASLVNDNDNILLVGDSSSITINAKDIPVLSRASMGNQLIKNSNIIKATKV